MSPTKLIVAFTIALAAQHGLAQQAPTSGTLVIVPATAEVTHANDQATAIFSAEEQDKDKAAAASRVNRKMREAMELLRKADPQARLKTFGYYTYPVYPEDQPPRPLGAAKRPAPAMWRVGQQLEFKTTNLGTLEKTVAAAQRGVGLSSLQFGLAPETEKKLDAQRIAATYRNLNDRVAAIAAAMGRKTSDAVVETVDFEGSGRYDGDHGVVSMSASRTMEQKAMVEEPSFEPGETTLQMRLVGKVRFK